MKTKLKDLDFSILENNLENEKNKFIQEIEEEFYLKTQQIKEWNIPIYPISILEFCYINVEIIAERKKQMLSKKKEITKNNIIMLFENAGFEYFAENCYHIGNDILTLVLTLREDNFIFHIEGDIKGFYNSTESFNIDYTDLKRIEFYYNIFRQILEFEENEEEAQNEN
jgi:hypothetical protein